MVSHMPKFNFNKHEKPLIRMSPSRPFLRALSATEHAAEAVAVLPDWDQIMYTDYCTGYVYII